jgi:hypothetical protein
VLALAAERAVERVLRIAAANPAHFRAALRDAAVLVNFERQQFRPIRIYALEGAEEGLPSHAYLTQAA